MTILAQAKPYSITDANAVPESVSNAFGLGSSPSSTCQALSEEINNRSHGCSELMDIVKHEIPAGDRGPPGPRGSQGLRGPKGDRGPRGPRGIDGKDGQDGEDGKDGADGSDGVDGAPGAPGTVTSALAFSWVKATVNSGTAQSLSVLEVTATCPGGMAPVSITCLAERNYVVLNRQHVDEGSVVGKCAWIEPNSGIIPDNTLGNVRMLCGTSSEIPVV